MKSHWIRWETIKSSSKWGALAFPIAISWWSGHLLPRLPSLWDEGTGRGRRETICSGGGWDLEAKNWDLTNDFRWFPCGFHWFHPQKQEDLTNQKHGDLTNRRISPRKVWMGGQHKWGLNMIERRSSQWIIGETTVASGRKDTWFFFMGGPPVIIHF